MKILIKLCEKELNLGILRIQQRRPQWQYSKVLSLILARTIREVDYIELLYQNFDREYFEDLDFLALLKE